MGKYKVYIIDEVHMLTNHAFNALLKTLEEPPENVIFILATTEVHKVLDTIKSRCQRFDFKRITTDDIVKHLRFIADSEKINITDDALFTIAKNSAGGMRDSIALLDQLSVLDGENAISTDDINNLLGRLSFDTLNSLAEKIVNSKPQEALEDLEKIYNSGNEPVQILTNLMDYLKNLLIVKNCRKEIVFELTQANEAQLKALNAQCENIETHQIVFLIDKCSEYIKELKLTNNPRLWLEVAIIDLANLTENTKLVELQNRLARLEGGVVPVQNNYVSSVQPVNVAAYKTAPTPVTKPEVMKQTVSPLPMGGAAHADTPSNTDKTVPTLEKFKISTRETSVRNSGEGDNLETSNLQVQQDDFSPMPKSKPVEGADVAAAWGQLLELIASPPTRALLKQWGNAVKITPEETILTMKSEIFLNQVQTGTKKQAIVDAVNNLFGQTNSNIIIRLPQAGDDAVRQVAAAPVKPKEKPQVKEVEPVVEPKEIEEIKAEVKKETKPVEIYSDNVKMVMDLFDGKIID